MPLLCCTASLAAQEDKKEWAVNNPPGPHTDTELTFTEGTWLNLDVSPDGQTIAFDLLGDIYTMPIEGGEATLLRGGLAWEVQPRFSPDGTQILFTSDAGGGDNIWVMDSDGSEAQQLTEEDFRLLNNAVWMPDGEYFIARKHFTSSRSLGAGEMWMYHKTGGSGFQLTERKNDQQDVNEPSVSPDGRYVYFSEDMYPGGAFQYNKDPNSQIYVIRRYDRQEGKVKNIIAGPGGACRPEVSNDGSKLAFVRRVRTESVLFIHDLETGQNFPLFKGLSKDQQEAWAIFGVYTGFDWTPDDKHIVIWGQGKIWKVEVATGEAEAIPFKATAKHRFQKTVRFKNNAFEEQFTAKVIRHAVTSPDENTLVFSAIGHLWKKELPDGQPTRLTEDSDFEFEPSFSPDGKMIAYVSWDDEETGAIHTLDLGSGQKQQLTTNKGIYRTPRFSPDGKTIVYQKEGGNGHQGYAFCKEPGIYTISADGGEPSWSAPEEPTRFSILMAAAFSIRPAATSSAVSPKPTTASNPMAPTTKSCLTASTPSALCPAPTTNGSLGRSCIKCT